MAVVGFKVDLRPLDDMLYGRTGGTAKHLRRMGNKLERLAKRDVGKKTGSLMRSISVQMSMSSTGLVVFVGARSNIAFLHHEGTRPHVILPHTASVLRFRSRGKIVFAGQVNHPGTKANPYLSRNLAQVVLTSS